MITNYSLPKLGWSAFFQQQFTLEEWQNLTALRVMAQHRSEVELIGECGRQRLELTPNMPELTVGDWLLLDSQGRFVRLLERLSLFSRKASGSKVATQLIAANVDTVFVACSLNENFNLSRIERYLVLSKQAGAEAVVVLTKADHCDDPGGFVRQVQTLDPLLMVEAVNGLDPQSVTVLEPWCRPGKTIALLGSSGVGKSTLINTLLGQTMQKTGTIREDDSKGRHTTTGRSLHFMPTGGILLDTPGMRELQLADCEAGIRETFADIDALADRCRFSDCQHLDEPGCAVRAAIRSGSLNERRLTNYLKLLREQALNRESLAEKRARDRSLGRFYRSVKNEVRQRKKRD
ncbi:ribosome small subunit-dependent GTPase A [Dongshaea marina]|uniref:ribosome small subunit-dependent GTPase A n=1 Tax=Dongshaea marina TaxID=2047966 RepID=UPI000D3E5146|nr:ribosome small subunit-dependent GTPase A [Dongshaea marina]